MPAHPIEAAAAAALGAPLGRGQLVKPKPLSHRLN